MKVIELFAGIGSQTQALKNIGVEHEVVAIAEIDQNAAMSYEAIHGKVDNLGDITQIRELPKADLWTYSFPCQDISTAGKMRGFAKGSGTRSSLLWEVERLLTVAKENGTLPKYLLLENVKQLANSINMANFNIWLRFLNDLGYENYWRILNARDYGIPQNRERVFVVSIFKGQGYAFPKPIKLKTRASDYFEPASENMKLAEHSESRNLILYADKNTAQIRQATKAGCITIYHNGVADLSFSKSKNRRGRVIQGGKVCNTLTTSTGTLCKFVNGEFYNLSAIERWRLMGFPDEAYHKAAAVCSETELVKQAGNSICVNVLEAIFKTLLIENDLQDYQYNIFELNNMGVVNL